MRMFCVSVCVIGVGFFAAPAAALADTKSYSEVYGQDFASQNTSDVDQWQTAFRNAVKDCLAQYAVDDVAAAVPSAAPAKKKVAVAVKAKRRILIEPVRYLSTKRRTPILEQGSTAWNTYCASKYASFNPATGTYRSYGGKQKPCLVPG